MYIIILFSKGIQIIQNVKYFLLKLHIVYFMLERGMGKVPGFGYLFATPVNFVLKGG